MRALIALALLASSCVTHSWHRRGASRHEYDVDAYACERDARVTHNGRLVTRVNVDEEFFDRCMESKDWEWAADKQ